MIRPRYPPGEQRCTNTPSQDPDNSEPPADSQPDTQPGGTDEPAAPDEPDVSAGPLTLSQTDITIPAGETGRLTAAGGSGTVTWTSSNPEIASVEDGAVTGKAGGTVTITAASGEETATCQVKVEGEAWVDPNASSYQLSKTDFTLFASKSENTWQMKMKRSADAGWEIVGADDGVTWASSNTGVATVSETGLITRVGRGNATITATVGGATLECIVRMS